MSAQSFDQLERALVAVRLLLDGIATQVIVADENEHDRLQAELRDLSRQLTESSDSVPLVEAALRRIHEYNSNLSAIVSGASSAFPAILAKLTQSLKEITGAGEAMTKQLNRLQEALAKSHSQNEVSAVRRGLEEWIDAARVSSLHQSVAVNDSITALIRDCQELAEFTGQARMLQVSKVVPAAIDPLTGLPGRTSAEAALLRLVRHRYSYATVFHLDHLRPIHERYGNWGRDQLVLQFSQYLAQALAAPDCLFRWADSAFLGAVPEDSSAETSRMAQMRQLALTRHFCNLEFGGRVAMVPITCRYKFWDTFGADPDRLLHEIDTFIEEKKPN